MVRIKNSGTTKSGMDRKMHCPRCSAFLRKRFMKKVSHPSGALLDVCQSCGGMWIDKNEVKLLYDFSRKGKK